MVLGTPGITPARVVRQEANKLGIYESGIKVAEIDNNGNLKLKGEVNVLEIF